MGFFDYLTCAAEIPGLGVPVGVQFQTRSLLRASAELTISAGGRLVYHQARHEQCGTREVCPGITFPVHKKIPLADRDLDFHGDVLFCGSVDGQTSVAFIARFTHGQLEWIRSSDELPELQQRLLDHDW